MPVLFIARDGEAMFPLLLIDNQMGGYIAITHLIQSRHRKIVCITGTVGSIVGAARLLGYQNSLASAGIEISPDLLIEGVYESQKAFDSTVALIRSDVNFN